MEWTEWYLYTSRYIPVQRETEEFGNDSGVHICSWAYVLCTSKAKRFSENDMNSAIKGIANILAENYINEEQAKDKIKLCRELFKDYDPKLKI
ncbi:hypothetical protein TSAR_000323 [Trichomalopsis sarcophagae]|uniref:Uncharacterized protein n=1 Tax=Trichomalopsis sarcophagae TaxID=543379 RepID=A0A232FCW7_9HYME|nr:hypothetical protein TSAR_000323 [Trichomalopsis sarcophagae]